jgi:hypothetical protein
VVRASGAKTMNLGWADRGASQPRSAPQPVPNRHVLASTRRIFSPASSLTATLLPTFPTLCPIAHFCTFPNTSSLWLGGIRGIEHVQIARERNSILDSSRQNRSSASEHPENRLLILSRVRSDGGSEPGGPRAGPATGIIALCPPR